MKTQSDSLSSLATALAAAQAEMPDVVATETAKVTSTKGTYSYTYSDLAAVRATVLPVLTKHGLSVTQTMVPRREGLVAERWAVLGQLRTTLLHSSGEWIAGEQPIAGDWSDPQRIGSAISYARRYGLVSICCVGQVDDDGRDARPVSASYDQPRRAAQANGPPPRSNGPPASNGPDVKDFDNFDEPADPGSSRYYREHPEMADREEAARDFSRQESAARFSNGPPSNAAPDVEADPRIDPRNNQRVVLPSDVPRTGKFLYGWARDHGQLPFFTFLSKTYPQQIPAQIKEWSDNQVAWGWTQYVKWFNSPLPLPVTPAATNNGARR